MNADPRYTFFKAKTLSRAESYLAHFLSRIVTYDDITDIGFTLYDLRELLPAGKEIMDRLVNDQRDEEFKKTVTRLLLHRWRFRRWSRIANAVYDASVKALREHAENSGIPFQSDYGAKMWMVMKFRNKHM